MNEFEFNGTGTALVTPFNEKKEIDFKSLENLIENSIKGGIDYFVILGTTAEPSTLNNKEKNDIINCFKEVNNKRVPLVLSIGGNNTQEIVKQIIKRDLSDFNAILSVSPYYNCPTQEGIYHHFHTLAKVIKNKIILYNVPSRTGSNISTNTVLRLVKQHNNIIGIKESSGNSL
jgi:4-hydroxy-tetrahydrodipicolinate synthase